MTTNSNEQQQSGGNEDVDPNGVPKATIEELSADIKALKSAMAKIELAQAESKPIGEIVRLLLYFWAAVSVVLGLFGWKQLSDIERMVDKQVRLQLPSDKAKFAEYSRLIDETQKLHVSYEKLAHDYRARVRELNFADTVSKEFDIEGQIQRILKESDIPGNEFDPGWRTRAIATINTFKDVLGKKTFSADFIFNVAQVCRQLGQYDLVKNLTELAHNNDPSPPIRAMYFAAKVSISTGPERQESLAQLLKMVENLTPHSPHIVLSEAWNAAENSRSYSRLIASLESLLKNRGSKTTPEEYVPSYAYFILARIYLRQSAPGAIERAKSLAITGDARLQGETPLSEWHSSSVRESIRVKALTTKSGKQALFQSEDEDQGAGLTELLRLLKQSESVQSPKARPPSK